MWLEAAFARHDGHLAPSYQKPAGKLGELPLHSTGRPDLMCDDGHGVACHPYAFWIPSPANVRRS
jgi:hypothetical protein